MSSSAEKRLTGLRKVVGTKIALWAMCAVCDVQYDAADADLEWDEYILLKKGKHFADGETSVRAVLDSEGTDRAKWVSSWGRGSPDNPYSDSDYQRLDEIFAANAQRLTNSGGYDPQQENTLRIVSQLTLQIEKSIVKGDKEGMDISAKATDIMQKLLSSEQLRRADAKPVENIRIDDVARQLERNGLKMDMTPDDVWKAFHNWQHKMGYSCTMDAAEKTILAMLNAGRMNDNLSELDVLPKAFRLDDASDNFAPEQSEEEKEAYRFLGMTYDSTRVKNPVENEDEPVASEIFSEETVNPEPAKKPATRKKSPPKKKTEGK